MYLKPKHLKPGSRIAVLSPSWGGPAVYPHVHESGIRIIEELGFKVIEFPTARMDADILFKNPPLRAKDLNDAFADPEIAGIVATIGGSDSARILKYLNVDSIIRNPKFVMGFSDTTSINVYLNLLGLVTFNGPSVMAGFSQFHSFDEDYKSYLRDALFHPEKNLTIPVFRSYADGYPEWSNTGNTGKTKESKINDGWHWIQGHNVVNGRLFGGCIEILEMIKGTDFWPNKDFWIDRILFLETSDDKPSIAYIKCWLRNYGVMGVFDRISGILMGRARDYTDQEKKDLDAAIVSVIRDEFGNSSLPIVTNMDFGHTDPQLILPLGIKMEIDSNKKQMRLLENPYNDGI